MNPSAIAEIYLDNNSTTPCDPRVIDAILPFFHLYFGNPSSQHLAGQRAARAIELARTQVERLIGAASGEIIFTGGSTESNNLAILGIARSHSGNRKKIITFKSEHKAILNIGKQLEQEGFKVVLLDVDSKGRIDVDALATNLDECTLLVSAQLANNEVGTIQPLRQIAELAHEYGAIVHTDATQAVGKIPVDVDELDVDLMSISAHKFYGPKGVGALFIRGGPRAIPIAPLGYGGGQEWELRSGTHNVPAIVGFGEAARISAEELEGEMVRIAALRDRLEQLLQSYIPQIEIHGDIQQRLPGTSSLYLPGTDAEALLANVPELMLSTGAACNSGAPEPSYVLLALGLSWQRAYSTLRIGVGRFNTEDEISTAAKLIGEAYYQVIQK
ncbi:Cysteine desulfurase IscS [Calidithermus terrae]|uniref:cysteine desulfurase n=1 Tax=Calidithermus terrae TaxID=1408545 RepID=A0A399F0D8_9DEIN|nr:cysteine desulfurase family protein [Calidithermus terrae]RIH90247.1 Cysteine desulfurase IscS [Calidithermus terrae]